MTKFVERKLVARRRLDAQGQLAVFTVVVNAIRWSSVGGEAVIIYGNILAIIGYIRCD